MKTRLVLVPICPARNCQYCAIVVMNKLLRGTRDNECLIFEMERKLLLIELMYTYSLGSLAKYLFAREFSGENGRNEKKKI